MSVGSGTMEETSLAKISRRLIYGSTESGPHSDRYSQLEYCIPGVVPQFDGPHSRIRGDIREMD